MRIKGYPSWFYSFVTWVTAALFISGCLLAPTTINLKLEWDVPWRLSSDQHIGIAAMHATLSFLMMSIIGALWSIHMRAGWKRRKNHQTGVSLMILLALLELTAIGIYYLGDGQASMYSSVVHMFMGFVIPLFLLVHIIVGRRYQIH